MVQKMTRSKKKARLSVGEEGVEEEGARERREVRSGREERELVQLKIRILSMRKKGGRRDKIEAESAQLSASQQQDTKTYLSALSSSSSPFSLFFTLSFPPSTVPKNHDPQPSRLSTVCAPSSHHLTPSLPAASSSINWHLPGQRARWRPSFHAGPSGAGKPEVGCGGGGGGMWESAGGQ